MKLSVRSLLATSVLLILTACAVRSVTPGDAMEINMDFDMNSMDMRHGWALLTPPKLTYVGSNDEDSIKRGKKMFEQHCQKCHGPTGVGDGPLAKKMNIMPANLQNVSEEVTNTYLVVQINRGKGDMPQWEDYLDQRQQWDLTNYIRTLGVKSKKEKKK